MNPETKKLLDESTIAARNAASAASLNFTPGYNQQTYAPISSSSLAPVTPMNLKQPDPLTGADGMLGAMEQGAANFQAQQQQQLAQNAELQKLKTETDTSKSSYLDQLGLSQGQTALEDQAYASVDPIEQELNSINQELLQEQHGLRRQIEGLDKQPGTIEQKNQIAYDMKKQSATLQADLSLIQMAKQNQFSSAKNIADRRVAVMQEKQRQNLELLKYAYEENRDQYNKQESREFEQMIRERERALDEEKDNKKTAFAFAAEAAKNGAPSMLISQALSQENPQEVLSTLAQFMSDPLEKQRALLDEKRFEEDKRQFGLQHALASRKIDLEERDLNAKLDAANADISSGFLTDKEVKAIDLSPEGKKITTLGDLKKKVGAYRTLVEEYGTELYGAKKALIDGSYADLKIAWKEAANLGALTGPDIEVLLDAAKPVTGLRGAKNVFTSGGARGAIGGLDQMVTRIDTDATTVVGRLYARNPKYKDSAYVETLVAGFDMTEGLLEEASPEQLQELKNAGLIQ